jgi:HAMP domain-containing protein
LFVTDRIAGNVVAGGTMRLTAKIILVLSGTFVVGLALGSFAAYRHVTDSAVENSAGDARIVMEAASAVRSYTAESISPLLQEQMKTQFLPYAIPSFAAQTNAKLVQKKLPEYSYREPTLNPTNVNDRATDWEAAIVNEFRNNSEITEKTTVRDTPNGPLLTMARPLKVGAQVCLNCHSTPDVAPPTMIALYGSQNGFGWKLGEVIGAQLVSIPLSVPLQRAYAKLPWMIAGIAGILLILLIVIGVVLRALIVKPMIGISELANDVSMGKLDSPEFSRAGRDELGSLATSFNRMRRSLQNAMKMLEEQP